MRGRVNDLANLLTPEQRQQLEQELARFEERKGSQIAVLTVPTTKPETIEQYGIRVADTWKLGRQGVDDGALLLVASEDRAVRIEVGYGLEGILPDAIAKRIIEEHIIPFFQQGNFYGGIETGLRKMMEVIEGEALPPPSHRGKSVPGNSSGFLFLGFVGILLGGLMRTIIGRLPAALLGGGLIGFVLWLVTGNWGLVILVSLLVFITILGIHGYGGRIGAGRWIAGGFGGGFGGGGFSGRGGGFGGGGASGRW